MPAVATSEPDTLVAGDSAAWTISLADYPANDGWALSYGLQGPAQLTIPSTASGASFAIALAAATTAAYWPGLYSWSAFVTKGSDRYTVARGSLTILANPAAASTPTHAATTLALIEAALVGRIPRGLEETTIDGQHLNRIKISELYALREKYRREVFNEQRAAGRGPSPIIGIRFVNPR